MITIDPEDQEDGFDRFVHADEVATLQKQLDEARAELASVTNKLLDTVRLYQERDAYRAALLRLAEAVASPGADDLIDMMAPEDADVLADAVLGRLTAAEDALRDIAVSLGQPDQDVADLPASVEALCLQRDRLLVERDAYRAAMLRLARAVAPPGARDMVEMMTAEEADDVASIVLERLQTALASALTLRTAAQDALSLGRRP